MSSSLLTLRRFLVLVGFFALVGQLRADDLKVAVFDVDATPPVGSMMAYDPVKAQGELGLRARGIVLLGAGEPVVLCAVDWIGISNEGNDVFRQVLAAAAGTTPSRVAVHTLHQHDAPACDFAAERLLREVHAPLNRYDGTFAREVLARLKTAIHDGLPKAQPVTQIGLGRAEVKEVASNRRILGPEVSLISFWNGDTPVAVLSYYACHPQSYYRTGIANPDFPGIARYLRGLEVPDALHVHFDGAGGNIGAGKYNDGSHAMRWVLAQRLADGMKRAWEATEKFPVTAKEVGWKVEPVAVPAASYLTTQELETMLHAADADAVNGTAARLVWLRRCEAGHKIDLSCLRLGKARILHMPGELFVEYQLAAKKMRPELFVAMAAYGDYGPGYVGTDVGYEQGGYETSQRASNTAPGAEAVLMDGIRKLLRDE